MSCKCGAMVKASGAAAGITGFRADSETDPQGRSAKSAARREPARFVRIAERLMRARTATRRRPTANGARRCAETTSAVRKRSSEDRDTARTHFRASLDNAAPSIQPASQAPGTISARPKFPAETGGGKTPDAPDERWLIRRRH